MKIEVGKFYKCRDGKKVRIYALDGHNGNTIHGAYLSSDGYYNTCWGQDGRFTHKDINSDNDIVSEWEDPKPRMYAYMHKISGEIFMRQSDQIENVNMIRMPHLDEPVAKLTEGKNI